MKIVTQSPTSNANVPRLYVLGGRSYGGQYAREYAGQYGDEVAGLVLLDSSHAHERESKLLK